MLSLIRRKARQSGLAVEELPGRGKGSHHVFSITDSTGKEVARFSLTGHNRDLSWTVMRQIEDGLAHLWGGRWTER
jgi:hypothetical protein